MVTTEKQGDIILQCFIFKFYHFNPGAVNTLLENKSAVIPA
jgi:hypothetical protein